MSSPTELLQEIRDRLADLPQRLAAVLNEKTAASPSGGGGRSERSRKAAALNASIWKDVGDDLTKLGAKLKALLARLGEWLAPMPAKSKAEWGGFPPGPRVPKVEVLRAGVDRAPSPSPQPVRTWPQLPGPKIPRLTGPDPSGLPLLSRPPLKQVAAQVINSKPYLPPPPGDKSRGELLPALSQPTQRPQLPASLASLLGVVPRLTGGQAGVGQQAFPGSVREAMGLLKQMLAELKKQSEQRPAVGNQSRQVPALPWSGPSSPGPTAVAGSAAAGDVTSQASPSVTVRVARGGAGGPAASGSRRIA